jgi:hypothetical protein
MATAVCSVEGCARTVLCRGWCGFHYQRWRLNGDPLPDIKSRKRQPPRKCSVEGCDADYHARDMCFPHYTRWYMHGNPEEPPRRARNGEGYRGLNHDGYIVLKSKGTQILEHRKVMQDILGRALLPEETVHHLNGIRTDNRPENLELWVGTRSRPAGG